MRILMISNFLDTPELLHGAVFIRHRVDSLRRQGHSVTLVPILPVTRPQLPLPPTAADISWPEEPPSPDYQAEAIPVRLSSFVAALGGLPRAVSRDMAANLQATVERGFDIVVGHGSFRFPAAGVARELSLRSGLPYVAAAHGSDVLETRRLAVPYQRDIFAGAAATLFVSRGLQASAESAGFAPANPHVVGNGFDASIFSYADNDHEGPPRLLFVGSLTPVKGADRLPAIMRAVWDRHPEAQLTVAGSGSLASALDHPHDKRVSILGAVPHESLPGLMQQSDLLIVPSRNEGFGCVVKEAQATGTPVLASDVGGLRESVGAGGRLVRGGADWNPETFAAGVEVCLNEVSRQEAASAAVGYSWDEIAMKEAAVFADVLMRS